MAKRRRRHYGNSTETLTKFNTSRIRDGRYSNTKMVDNSVQIAKPKRFGNMKRKRGVALAISLMVAPPFCFSQALSESSSFSFLSDNPQRSLKRDRNYDGQSSTGSIRGGYYHEYTLHSFPLDLSPFRIDINTTEEITNSTILSAKTHMSSLMSIYLNTTLHEVALELGFKVLSVDCLVTSKWPMIKRQRRLLIVDKQHTPALRGMEQTEKNPGVVPFIIESTVRLGKGDGIVQQAYSNSTLQHYENITQAVTETMESVLFSNEGIDEVFAFIISNSNHSALKSANGLIIRSLEEEVPVETETNENSSTEIIENDENGAWKRGLRLGFASFLLTIGGISLLFWSYFFYIRYRFSEEDDDTKLKQEDGCCEEKPCDKNVFPISLPSPVGKRGNKLSSPENVHATSFEMTEDLDESDSFDSFGKELEKAANVDRHAWLMNEGHRKRSEAMSKFVPSLAPPAKDVISVSAWSADEKHPPRQNSVNLPSSFLSRYMPSVEDMRRSMARVANHSPFVAPNPSDPGDLVFTSGSSTDTGSYAGLNSSTEEGEHGFEVIDYRTNASDEMNANLLNPIPAGDDDSLGHRSGMEMSLGTDEGLISSSSSVRGFFVIDEESDMVHEYIPQEEYEAAVQAAAAVIQNRLTPRPRDEELGLGDAPSDELQGNFRTAKNIGGGISVDSSSESNPAIVSQSTSSLSSEPTDGESLLSPDVFKELKSMSIFLKHYEKKKAQKLKKQNLKSKSSIEDNQPSRWGELSENDDTTTFSNDTSTLDSRQSIQLSTDTDSKESYRKRRFRRPTFARKKKQGDKEQYSKLEAKLDHTTKISSKPGLPPFSPQSPIEKRIDDDVRKGVSSTTPRNKIAKTKLPVTLPVTPRTKNKRDIRDSNLSSWPLNPATREQNKEISVVKRDDPNVSRDSGNSDAEFLANEIVSFFDDQEPFQHNFKESKSPVISSEKLTIDFSKDSASQVGNKAVTSPSTSPSTSQSTYSSIFSGSETGNLNRLGAAPFNVKEAEAVVTSESKDDTKGTNIQRKDASPVINKKVPPSPHRAKLRQRIFNKRKEINSNQAKKVQIEAALQTEHTVSSVPPSSPRDAGLHLRLLRDQVTRMEREENEDHDKGYSHGGNQTAKSVGHNVPTRSSMEGNVSSMRNALTASGDDDIDRTEKKDVSMTEAARDMFETGRKNIVSMFDKSVIPRTQRETGSIRNPNITVDTTHVVPEETRGRSSPSPENLAAHALISRFESKHKNQTPLLPQANMISPRGGQSNSRGNTPRGVVSNRINEETLETIISPSAVRGVNSRGAQGKMHHHHTASENAFRRSETIHQSPRSNEINYKSQNQPSPRSMQPTSTTPSNTRHNDGLLISTRIKPASQSPNAQNLISMFESKKSDSGGIFPQSEHWQHAGGGNRNGRR